MPVSNPSLPSVPDGLYVDGLRLDAAGVQRDRRSTLASLDAAGVVISARTIAAEAVCPSCGRASGRVHSTSGGRSRICLGRIGPWPGGSRSGAFAVAIARDASLLNALQD